MRMRMAGWATLLGVALAAAGATNAQGLPSGVTPADQQAIRHVIRSQIEAFQRDDAAAAFALASPSIQAKFGTADNFMRIVRHDYRSVYRPRTYDFLELSLVDGTLMQKLALIGPDGLAVVALYPMVKGEDGSWRTDGCYLIPMEWKGA